MTWGGPKDHTSCCCPRQKMGWWQKLCPGSCSSMTAPSTSGRIVIFGFGCGGNKVTKCVDSDSGVKIKIYKLQLLFLTLSPPREISRTAVNQLALPYNPSLGCGVMYHYAVLLFYMVYFYKLLLQPNCRLYKHYMTQTQSKIPFLI
jgi:hypothetical protein